MQLHRNESGQMLIMTALELLLLIGFLALAADVGVLFHSKRHMQAAADAAATAGALNDYNYSLGYTTQSDSAAALAAATQNGYTDGQDGVVVTVNTPPKNGYHKLTGYVEVIISKPDPNYFFKVFTGNNTTTVAARAVAGDPVGAQGCITVNTLYLQGVATISGPNGTLACGINVNGSIYNNDAGTTINASYLHTPSGVSEKKATTPTPTTTGSDPNPPYTNLYPPNPNDAANGSSTQAVCNAGNTYTGSTYDTGSTLPTGQNITYTDAQGNSQTLYNVVCFGAVQTPGQTLVASSALTIGSNSQSDNNFPAGFYIFENGATMNGQVTFGANPNVQGTSPAYSQCYSDSAGASNSNIGAVLYNYAGQLQQSNGQLGVCGPTDTSYKYNGVAIFQPTNSTATPQNPPANSSALDLQFGMSGNAGTSCTVASAALNGYIVAPDATVSLHDNGGGLMVTGIVANELYDKASTLITCDYNTVNASTTPLRAIALVE